MAPREEAQKKTKVQRMMSKSFGTQRIKSPVTNVKKSSSSKSAANKVLKAVKDNNLTMQARCRTTSVPLTLTPKPKEKKTGQPPGSACKSAKKENWKRRPKPAHSGVPVPEKWKKLAERQLQDPDCSL